MNIDTILEYTPEHLGLAIIVILCFFALKSLSIIIPLTILYLSCGILFPPFIALIVSTAGLWITITIPYLIGRIFGTHLVEYVKEKYPQTKKIDEYQKKNTYFACFITRIIGIIPADVLSIYFGSCRVSYPVYAVAGVAGSLLSIITTTLLGMGLDDPFSKEFMIVLSCRILAVIVSVVLNHKVAKNNDGEGKEYGK